jgi:hypothetical protein
MNARRQCGIKKSSLRQEKETAADVGGRTQINSGAVRMGGGADVRGVGMRIECKFTEKDSYVLKFKELEKLRKQAIKTLEAPVFQFAFKFRNTMKKYAVLPDPELRERVTVEGTKYTINDSITLHRDELGAHLLLGPVFVEFTTHQKRYQIVDWDDFLKKMSGPQDTSIGYKWPMMNRDGEVT